MNGDVFVALLKNDESGKMVKTKDNGVKVPKKSLKGKKASKLMNL